MRQEGDGRRRREASPTRSAQSTEGESGGARMDIKVASRERAARQNPMSFKDECP